MKFRKILTGIMASALMACSGISAVSANAAAAVNADVTKSIQIVDNLDRMISLRRTMPIKGDINGDKKITTEDTAVLEAYINKLVTITPYSRAYKILDVNWDGKLDSKDLSCMKAYTSSNQLYSIGILYTSFNTGDINHDNVVNASDLKVLSKQISYYESAAKNPRMYDQFGITYLLTNRGRYAINHDSKVDSKDYDLLKSYITLYPGLLLGTLL